MKWFFLPFIPLLATVGNLMLLEQLSAFRLLGAATFNLFVLSLISLWWNYYFKLGVAKAEGLILSNALFIFSLAVSFTLLGAQVTTSGSCSTLISSGTSFSFRSKFAAYVQSIDLCRELGLLIVMLGVLTAYPSIRLFMHAKRHA
jgi:hypothetical protein